MSIRKKMAHGVLWTFLEKFGQQFIFIAVFAVLTRLIGPEEFGYYSFCYVFITFSTMVILSVNDSIVVNKTEDDQTLSTLFWAINAAGLFLSVLTFFMGAPLALAMKAPRIESLLQALSCMPLLTAISTVPTGLVQKRMDFRLFTLRSLVSTFFSGIVGIGVALHGGGAFSMIAQQITQQTIVNLIIWPSAKWVPRFFFDAGLLRAVIAPGVKKVGSSMIDFFEAYMPRILIGAYLGPASVGYYSFAARLWIALREIMVVPVTTVLYPALVHTRDDMRESKQLMAQIAYFTGLIVCPVVAGTIAIAPQFVPLFFGTKWLLAVPVIKVFLLGMLTNPFLTILCDVLRARRQTGAYVVLHFILVAIAFGLMFLLVGQGLVALCLGLAAFSIVAFPLNIAVLSRVAKFTLAPAFLALWAPAAAALTMYAGLEGIEQAGFYPSSPGLHLVFSIAAGAVIYVTASAALQYRRIGNAIGFVRKLTRLAEESARIERPADAPE